MDQDVVLTCTGSKHSLMKNGMVARGQNKMTRMITAIHPSIFILVGRELFQVVACVG